MSDLHELAEVAGVATEWTGYGERPVTVSDDTLRTVLHALDVLEEDEDPATALGRWHQTRDKEVLPATTVVRPGTTQVAVALPEDAAATLITEAGDHISLPVTGDAAGAAATSGKSGTSGVRLPMDLPLGYHQLVITAHGDALTGETLAQGHLIVAPERAPTPDRGWGWMVQLYAIRSADSWGVGDLEDLRQLLRWSATAGADFVVSNPLHAAGPLIPQQPSPYFPSSRRFWNPSYIRVEQVPELTLAPPQVREHITALASRCRADNTGDHIDRDKMWAAKREALDLLWHTPHTPAREEAFQAFKDLEGEPLRQFALWCALSEIHGNDWRSWPESVRHPSTATADAEAVEEVDADRVAFFEWLQFLADEQLAAAQAAALHDGMRLGVIHDLAVGVNPEGADSWALQDHLATGVTVGAPPDDFNQQGQDWAQPPLLPQRMTETGYVVVRDLVRRLLRHAGGIRIDHILGYFRLFWIPPGGDPTQGTYVTYPADDLLGVLALEATRAGAVIIGEDLGVVAPGVREAMHDRRLLGSRLLYFAYNEDDERLPAAAWDRYALASITTHDLPTAAGWWSDEAVRIQAELGLLGDETTPEDEYARKRNEHASMEALLSEHGLLPANPTDTDRVTAMHAFLGRSASILVAANLPDAVGDIRQPNVPGTTDEYPNWRLPLATVVDGTPAPITLEDVVNHPLVARTMDALRATRERDQS